MLAGVGAFGGETVDLAPHEAGERLAGAPPVRLVLDEVPERPPGDVLRRVAAHPGEGLVDAGVAPLRVHLVDAHPGVVLGRPEAAFGQHLPGGLQAGAVHPRDRAVLVVDRGVGEGGPRLLVEAAPPQDEGRAFVVRRVAAERRVHQRADAVPVLPPHGPQGAPQGVRVLGAEDVRVGVVVEEREVVLPAEEHRHPRLEDEVDGGAERGGPFVGMAERRSRPVVPAHAAAHLSTSDREGSEAGAFAQVPVP